MSTTHETPVAATEAAPATAPSSAVETAAPTSTVEPSIEATQPVTTAEPAATTTSTTEPAVTEAAPTTETPKDGKADDLVKVEATPITSGNLGYKTGPLKLFKFSQRYFWLGDEAPLEESTISHFHKGNHENKHHTAAHASQTGKGLLLFAKRAEDKTSPEGIFNLADVTDVLKEGSIEFSFKVHDKKQSFQATKSSERDGWLVAINNAVKEAISNKDTLRESEGYKNSYKKYFGTAGVAAVSAGAAATTAAAVTSKDAKTDDKVADEAAAPATTTTKSEPAVIKKDNSRSRSRGFLGKLKNEKAKAEDVIEKKKDEKATQKEVKKEEKAVAKEEKKEEKAEHKKTDEAAVVGAGAAAGTAVGAAATHDKDTTETKTPVAQKRSSRFGSVGNIFGSNKKSTDVKPTTEPVATEAPQVDSTVESGAPLTESVPTEAPAATTAPVAETTPATSEPAVAPAATTAPVAAAATTTEPKKTKEKSPSRGLKGFFSKKEAQVEKKVEEKKVEKEEKKEEKKVEKEEEKAVGSTSETAAPVAGLDGHTPFAASAVPTGATTETPAETTAATPAAATTTTTAPTTEATPVVGSTKKEERRRSIFDSFKSKPKVASETKETPAEGVASEHGVDEPKDKKLFNLFRSSSKKASNEPAASSTTAADAPPVPAKDEISPAAATTEAAPLATETKTEAPLAAETKPEVNSVTADPPAEAVPTTTSTGHPITA